MAVAGKSAATIISRQQPQSNSATSIVDEGLAVRYGGLATDCLCSSAVPQVYFFQAQAVSNSSGSILFADLGLGLASHA